MSLPKPILKRRVAAGVEIAIVELALEPLAYGQIHIANELLKRHGHNILIAVIDGLKGIAEALGAVFPATTLQNCIAHLIRNSLDYASWKDRKALAAALRPIYTAPSAEAAAAKLDAFDQGALGRKCPHRDRGLTRAWD